MAGASGSIFAIGDCTASSYAPTAQVASQQGAYLARQFAQIAKKEALEAKLSAVRDRDGTEESKKEIEDLTRQLEKLKLRPFHYSHQGSLAYVSFFSFLKWNLPVPDCSFRFSIQIHWLRKGYC